MQWDFNNYEAKEFRLRDPPSRLISRTSYKKYPRYLNKVENYKFKYTYVNVQFEKYTFSISVFDKPRELKEKIAEISNKEHLNKNSIVIQLKNKESYIYGDELLIDFEPIYNALIKSQTLKLVYVRKSEEDGNEHNIKFWVKDGKEDFKEFQFTRNQTFHDFDQRCNFIHLYDLNKKVEIDITSF